MVDAGQRFRFLKELLGQPRVLRRVVEQELDDDRHVGQPEVARKVDDTGSRGARRWTGMKLKRLIPAPDHQARASRTGRRAETSAIISAISSPATSDAAVRSVAKAASIPMTTC